ncbi:MAG: hypothetical protein H6925_01725 [Holosporaceae bacterium]|nr:MAG: hypothetical protein H6925_01725 [Holosporaceae bacterium]
MNMQNPNTKALLVGFFSRPPLWVPPWQALLGIFFVSHYPEWGGVLSL